MGIIKSIIIALSTYSKIPMPQFKWEEKDMRYILAFFPLVGFVIGLLEYGWMFICLKYGIGEICYVLIGVAIPLIITGGIHVDGYMDTMDAFHSYQPKERKLEILKDSHIGAFSVIMLGAYGLVYIAAFSQVQDIRLFKILCVGFILSRALSGLAGVTFKGAKKEGILFTFSSNASKVIVRTMLIIEVILCGAYMIYISWVAGAILVGAAICSFVYYYFKCKKELGGITGDTEGYFLLLCQLVMAVTLAGLNVFALNII